MKMIQFLKQTALMTAVGLSVASISQAGEIYDARNLNPQSAKTINIDDLTAKIPRGAIVVIGEQHNMVSIQQGQMDLLTSLRKNGHDLNVGLEFLRYPEQEQIDAYGMGTLSEENFKKSSWGQSDFNFYRSQILFPNFKLGERTFGLNSPKNIPIAVKDKGLDNLSSEEKNQLPPNMQLGNSRYKERFIERMDGHVKDPAAMMRYFESQSVWDETIAWKACEVIAASDKTLVIIVGQFHVEYNDGLIERLHRRCGAKRPIVNIYQYLYYNDENVDLTPFAPSAKYGAISDYLMIVKQD